MKKPTLATLKSFIRKNEANLFIKCSSSFDGMTDCVQNNPNAAYRPIKKLERTGPFVREHTSFDNTLGFNGIWLVGGSRDYIKVVCEEGFTGFEVYNCCGSFTVAIPEAEARKAA